MTPSPSSESGFDGYAIGYAVSILLTLGSFYVAPAAGAFAAPLVVAAALAQLFAQLVFFLHLGKGGSSANRILLIFTVLIIAILVGGALWIMSNLARLHHPASSPAGLYQNGVVTPQNELD